MAQCPRCLPDVSRHGDDVGPHVSRRPLWDLALDEKNLRETAVAPLVDDHFGGLSSHCAAVWVDFDRNGETALDCLEVAENEPGGFDQHLCRASDGIDHYVHCDLCPPLCPVLVPARSEDQARPRNRPRRRCVSECWCEWEVDHAVRSALVCGHWSLTPLLYHFKW